MHNTAYKITVGKEKNGKMYDVRSLNIVNGKNILLQQIIKISAADPDPGSKKCPYGSGS